LTLYLFSVIWQSFTKIGRGSSEIWGLNDKTVAHNFETKADRNVILMPTPTFLGSKNPVKSLVWTSGVGHIGFQDGRRIKRNYLCTVSQKKIPDIKDCNLKKDNQILIIVDTNIPDTTGHPMTVRALTSPSVCSCTTWRSQNKRNVTFLFTVLWLFN